MSAFPPFNPPAALVQEPAPAIAVPAIRSVNDLSQLGFVPSVSEQPKPRLIVGVMGKPGTRKTSWALSAPGPIGYLNIGERPLEGVKERWEMRGKVIHCLTVPYDKPRSIKNRQGTVEEFDDAALAYATDVHNRVLAIYMGLLGAPMNVCRTIVIDVAGKWWDLLRLARHRKLQQVDQKNYGEVNREMTGIILYAMGFDKNVIWINHSKDEYVGRDKSGREEIEGFKHLEANVQVFLHMQRLQFGMPGTDPFFFTPIKCPPIMGAQNGQPSSLVLQQLPTEPWTFPALAQTVTTFGPEYWQDVK